MLTALYLKTMEFILKVISKISILGLFVCFNSFAVQGDFTVASIGVSNNTNTIFMETLESASTATECSNKKLFRLPDTDKSADKFFSAALAAQAQGKKITIDYFESECYQDAILIKVFRIRK